MLRWTLLRMMLLLWMTRITLQGGTGYQPQNPNGGAAQMSPGGYGSNSNTANMKGNGYSANKGTGAYGTAQNKPVYGGGRGTGMMNQQALKQSGAVSPLSGYGKGNSNGYKAPSYGATSQYIGHSNGGTKGPKPGYGSKAGPSNGQVANPKGYGGYPNGRASNQPTTGSSQYTGYPNGGTKGPKPGYGAKAGPSNGQGAKPNGYGGYPNGGAANQPNAGSSQYMGYPNSGTKGPKPGYGAKAGPSNGQVAKPNGYGGYPNGGPASQSNTGSSQYMGFPNAGSKGPKPGYGAKAGPSNGQGAKPNNGYGGYPNGGAVNQPNAGSSQFMGYSNGGNKGLKPGYGAKAGPSNGQGAKPSNGYGRYPNAGAPNQPNTGSSQFMGYPNGGNKGLKPGYGAKAGPSNGQGAKPNNGYGRYPYGGAPNQPNTVSSQYMGYPNGGTKGPKLGHGAKAGPSNGQGAKPNNGYGGYPNGGAANQHNLGSSQYTGYPNGGIKGPKPGYGANPGTLNGQGAKPNNGFGVPGYMSKGLYKAANSGYMPVTTGNQGVSSGKGPKGEILGPEAPSHPPVTSNTKGVLPLTEREATIRLLPEQTKDLPPVLQQTKGQNLQALLPQSKAPNPMAPQFAPKAFMQGPGSYKPSKAYKPLAIPQNKAPKPVASVVLQATPAPETASIYQTYQTVPQEQEQVLSLEQNSPQPIKGQGSISSQAAQTTPVKQQTKSQSNPALLHMKNPTSSNPALTGLEQPNGQVQGATPSKPDCGPNGQWVKLPSPGSGYPNGKGEKSSQPGFGTGMGGYPMNNGYKAGYGGYGNKFRKPDLGCGGYKCISISRNPCCLVNCNQQFIGCAQTREHVTYKRELNVIQCHAEPQGGQPTGLGSKGKSQTKYGIGGFPFGRSHSGYQTNPSGQYGNEGQRYGAKPYNPTGMGNYGYGSLPYNPQPLLPESVAKSPDFGGLPYNGQPLGYGSQKYGQKGLQYGGQLYNQGPDSMSGKHGSPKSFYNPETLNLGGNAKSAKYGNPAVSYELLGPVTDGQSVEENRSLEILPQGPEIDGQKSIDNFGDGEVPPHPDAPGAGEANAQSTQKYGTGDYSDRRVQPEVVSFPAVPTVGPAVASLDTTMSLDGSSPVPVSVPDVSAGPEVPVSPIIPQSELPTLMLQPAPPQQIHIQQHLKFHIQPHGNSQTAGKEGKYNLNGFFGNKYQG